MLSHRRCNGQTLTPAKRIGFHTLLGTLSQSHQLQNLSNPPSWNVAEKCQNRQIFPTGEIRVERWGFNQSPDIAQRLPRFLTCANANRPGITDSRVDQPQNGANAGCLPGAISDPVSRVPAPLQRVGNFGDCQERCEALRSPSDLKDDSLRSVLKRYRRFA